jgi:hypothetical protein
MMPRIWRTILLGLAALASAAGVAFAGAAPPAADPPRQVLMMLRLPPQHLRPNADYGGGYGDAMQRAALRRIAGRLARSNGLLLVDDWPMPLVGVDCFVLTAPGDRPLTDVAAELEKAPEVAWAQPMYLFTGQNAAPPPRLFLAEPAVREWRLADLHKVATGRNVRIALIDSMVDVGHPDLAGQVAARENFAPTHGLAPEQHGTAVAGVIAAKGVGIAGVAPGARLLALRACWQGPAAEGKAGETLCDSLSLAKALDFAVGHSAQVINLSLGGPPDPLLGKLIDAAEGRRIAVVAAYDPALPAGGFPASHPGVIAVADESWGAPPAGVYSAPGRDVPTTTPGGHWALVNGSSFAAAHVSGLVALLRERRPAEAGPVRLASQRGGGVDPCAMLLGVSCEKERAALPDSAALARR